MHATVAEVAAVQLAKLGGLLGLSPVAERGLSFTPNSDGDNPFGAPGKPRTVGHTITAAV